ncbi:[NiFe] hydrogenase nickel incorporation-associated protein HypB [Klebsiella pneumoniae]|uniref:Hydrogenase maturation factor HypB n=3 Tax=Klebsiella pneumoniae TaxID=573 RepID=A0A2X3D405_KLEPN|nr:[NiFe] hydrogenase nickel incorporation-associated protein HypB [Klebsiella pneumoniae]
MTITGVKTDHFAPTRTPEGDLHYGHGEAGTHAPGQSQRRMLEVEIDVLDKNNRLAARNRARFAAKQQLVLNLVSSPGSGKTTLLTETLTRLKGRADCAVIEGDQQTVNDAARIRATGTPAIQVNTGKGCHLDAQMIADAAPRLPLANRGILFIENVGNLVCPASFDLGERHKVAVLSVTEGEDKPLKYPHMFAAASLMLLNKVDLLPYLNFDVERCLACAREVNPHIEIILVSATSGEGMEQWLHLAGDAAMCIGIPGQICAIDGVLAKVEVCGIQRDVDLTLVGAVDEQGQPRLGQWVLVHVGFAMSVINEAEARDTLERCKICLTWSRTSARCCTARSDNALRR